MHPRTIVPEDGFDLLPPQGLGGKITRFCVKGGPEHGEGEIAIVRPGLDFAVTDIAFPKVVTRRYSPADALKIHIRLAGHSHFGYDAGPAIDVAGGTLLLLMQPRDTEKVETTEAERERSLTLVCTRDFVNEFARHSGTPLPPMLAQFLSGDCAAPVATKIALDFQLGEAAASVLGERASYRYKEAMYEPLIRQVDSGNRLRCGLRPSEQLRHRVQALVRRHAGKRAQARHGAETHRRPPDRLLLLKFSERQ